MSGDEDAAVLLAAFAHLPPDPHARQARADAEAARTLDAILRREDPS